MARLPSLVSALFLLAPPAMSVAQVRPEPGLVVDGKVVVRIYVTLHDDETPYYPVTHFKLRFFRSHADSVIATTDDAGTFTTLLRPGEYHVVSARDEVWKGARYSWDFSLTVKPGMAPLELREPTDPMSLGAAKVVRFGGRQASTVHRPPSTVYRPPSTVHRPPSTVYRLPSTVYRLPSTVYRLPSTVDRPPLPSVSHLPEL